MYFLSWLFLVFMVEFDQHFSMAARFAPTSKHFVLEVRYLLHQHLVASHKLFKQNICFISGKVGLIRVLPHGFSTHIVLDVFVHARSNVFMIILSKPFLKSLESNFFSLFSIDTSKNRRRHVFGLTVCKRVILQAKTNCYLYNLSRSAPRGGGESSQFTRSVRNGPPQLHAGNSLQCCSGSIQIHLLQIFSHAMSMQTKNL